MSLLRLITASKYLHNLLQYNYSIEKFKNNYFIDCIGLFICLRQAPFNSSSKALLSTSYFDAFGFASISSIALSINFNILSPREKCLPRILNVFQRYMSSIHGKVNCRCCAKKRSVFLTANFSIGKLFPAIRCLYLGASLK